MAFVEYPNVIEQFAADRSHPSLCNPVLPWATRFRRSHDRSGPRVLDRESR